uniref:Adenosine 3'-phospho 5'-phosphosulfate transporter 1 n=1 Tax=Elaeophora elaphi TaxID=1147741 RepID=A0A0R3RWY8_9BILA
MKWTMIAPYLNDFWLIRFLFILLSYGIVSIPVVLLVYCVRQTTENGFESPTLFHSFLRRFALGKPEYELITSSSVKLNPANSQERNRRGDSFHLLLCFLSLQATLVSMGYIQERIMTQAYLSTTDNQLNKFDNTQFLVFMNRVFAIILCAVYLILNWKREPPHVPPFYKHSFTSFSNTLSSWCQYEALKFVSFPTQTVCKASKVLPTMLMGFIVRGKRYGYGECACAVVLALGASLFLLSNNSEGLGSFALSSDRVTTVSGICLMCGYLLFDAFTLNWQKKLFDVRPQVSRYQMMFGVNMFSIMLCFATLIGEGTFLSPFYFLATHEGFGRDVFLLSLSGALGQVVIYTTIERFGPMIFAVLMTLRQILSILLSTVAYGHPMSVWSMFGLLITFSAIFGTISIRHYKTLQTRH